MKNLFLKSAAISTRYQDELNWGEYWEGLFSYWLSNKQNLITFGTFQFRPRGLFPSMIYKQQNLITGDVFSFNPRKKKFVVWEVKAKKQWIEGWRSDGDKETGIDYGDMANYVKLYENGISVSFAYIHIDNEINKPSGVYCIKMNDDIVEDFYKLKVENDETDILRYAIQKVKGKNQKMIFFTKERLQKVANINNLEDYENLVKLNNNDTWLKYKDYCFKYNTK